MEYCDGGDLSNFIKKRHALPEPICRQFLQQLALALRYLRDHGVCHMDLKPQNLLLTRRPRFTLKVGGSSAALGWLRCGSDGSSRFRFRFRAVPFRLGAQIRHPGIPLVHGARDPAEAQVRRARRSLERRGDHVRMPVRQGSLFQQQLPGARR